ncbi:type II toxin-antitoxin system RelE/ParE family toxin [bacterium]|nr:MAG: type II toxin-antitoxin system RelE/ParE family toxin [bacterium]
MSKSNYRISQEAISDLEHIWLYTLKKWSLEQADHYYALIIGEIEFISNNFMLGKALKLPKKNYRVVRVKSHLIFYRRNEHQIVEIVRILHQRMDVKKHLEA